MAKVNNNWNFAIDDRVQYQFMDKTYTEDKGTIIEIKSSIYIVQWDSEDGLYEYSKDQLVLALD